MKRVILLAAAIVAFARAAQAQQFPTRPVTLIVPWPAGGVDRHRHARARDRDRETSRPVDRDREQARRGRHASAPANMAASARPDGYTVAQIPITVFRLPFIQKTSVRSRQGLHLHHPPHRLHVRRGGEAPTRRGRRSASCSTTPRPIPARSTTARPAPARACTSRWSRSPSRRASSGRRCRSRAGRQHERAARRAHRRRRRTRPAGPAR